MMTNPVSQSTQEPQIDYAAMPHGQVVTYLASLTPIQYEQSRKAAAEGLGIERLSVLDNEVKKARQNTEDSAANDAIFERVEVYSEAVDAANVLDEIEVISKDFIICEPQTRVVISLWVALTWFVDYVDYFPIANITAPEKNCGKSTLLDFIKTMAQKPLSTSNISPSALFRMMDKWQPTLLIDEADSFVDGNEDLRGVINAGHERSGCVFRCVGDDHEPKKFSVWGAKALCGIGKRAGTIESRSVEMALRRKLPSEQTKRLKTGLKQFAVIKSKLARWAQDAGKDLRGFEPSLPKELQNRDADNWESLIALADIAGGNWAEKARQAAILATKKEPSLSINQELLQDIRELLNDYSGRYIFSSILTDKLNHIDDALWRTYRGGHGLSSRQLTNKLKEFSIISEDRRIGAAVKKGYKVEDFNDAFERYLSIPPNPNATTLQSSNGGGYSQISNATKKNHVANENALQPSKDGECSVVANRNGGTGGVAQWSEAI